MDTTSQQAMPAGWVVQLTLPAPVTPPRSDGNPWIGAVVLGTPLFQYFNVAIADPKAAVEATRKHSGSDDDATIGTVRALSSEELASISLSQGEIRRA
jgi:hypothetical protein